MTLNDIISPKVNELMWQVRNVLSLIDQRNLRLAMNAKTYNELKMQYAVACIDVGGKAEPTLFGINVLNDESLEDGCVSILEIQFISKPIHPEWW